MKLRLVRFSKSVAFELPSYKFYHCLVFFSRRVTNNTHWILSFLWVELFILPTADMDLMLNTVFHSPSPFSCFRILHSLTAEQGFSVYASVPLRPVQRMCVFFTSLPWQSIFCKSFCIRFVGLGVLAVPAWDSFPALFYRARTWLWWIYILSSVRYLKPML